MAAADQFFEITRMEPNLVQYRAENGIAFLTLNDPPANTYSYEMMQTLDARILAARMDESVQVIVLTGNGEKFFFRRREHPDARERHANLQILFLPAC